MRWKATGVIVVLAVALVALLGYGVIAERTDTAIDDAVARGERLSAPEARLPVLGVRGGGGRSVADFRGQVVVLNFWASWCPPCLAELPLLERTHRRIAPRQATVLGVNYKDIPEDALAFVRRFRLSFPNLRDRDGALAEAYASRAFPETFVIDRRGRVAARRRGPVDQRWLDRTLPRLLAEPS